VKGVLHKWIYAMYLMGKSVRNANKQFQSILNSADIAAPLQTEVKTSEDKCPKWF